MHRGEIWLADLDPSRGSKSDKVRPVVIVSHDAHNRVARRLGRGVLTVVPLTSSTRRVLTFQVLIDQESSGLPRDSKAQAEQVRALDVSRLVERAGRLTREQLAAVEDALRLHLDLD
ncbi:type II toxin-antitoxin system toxin endoribonuclease MazF9 [Isoptericola halotolerans]|uniref:mRNA interferase n=1 Tax=Isoptericola halotolerans TaxID=300560 RepID=A0ABX2A503_9MICO|nr:type II toxin-antitoxin system PemK/MazF family toxin [Isoptericola halotolerans]NOV97864.1 mRNA interferase MazF [Isoptericola halotolerans]